MATSGDISERSIIRRWIAHLPNPGNSMGSPRRAPALGQAKRLATGCCRGTRAGGGPGTVEGDRRRTKIQRNPCPHATRSSGEAQAKLNGGERPTGGDVFRHCETTRQYANLSNLRRSRGWAGDLPPPGSNKIIPKTQSPCRGNPEEIREFPATCDESGRPRPISTFDLPA